MSTEQISILIAGIGVVLSIFLFAISKALKTGEMRERVKHLEEKTAHSNCESNSKKIETVESIFKELNSDISYIKGQLSSLAMSSPTALVKSQSPISLTDLGKQVSKELSAEEMVLRNWEKINAKLESEIKDKNAYDIQQYCIESLAIEPEEFISDEDLRTLKNYAYNKGKSLQDFTVVLAIIIRDKYFKDNGALLEEIDVHDPNNNN